MSHRAFSDDDRAFIRAILTNPAEVSGWLVYADWLDDNDAPAPAEFLRLQVERSQLPPKDVRRGAIDARLSELRELVHRGWAAVFDRPMIENCDEHFAFRCPLKWENLQLTDDHKVRHCEACDKNVYHCNTVVEARGHTRAGECVAISLGVLRFPRDLEAVEEYVTMGILVPFDDLPALDYGRDELEPEPPPAPRPWWKFW